MDIHWIFARYPLDEIPFVANERRAPFLANNRRAFPRCSVHLIDWKLRSMFIGHKSDLIRWISTGGIYDFPAQGKVEISEIFNSIIVSLIWLTLARLKFFDIGIITSMPKSNACQSKFCTGTPCLLVLLIENYAISFETLYLRAMIACSCIGLVSRAIRFWDFKLFSLSQNKSSGER